jgi:hypothetical protein
MADDTKPREWWLHWNELSYANPDVYGPIVGGMTIQEAMYNTIQKWLPAYIYEFNRNLGGNILAIPKEYRVKPANRVLSRDLEASVLCVVNGTTGTPSTTGLTTRATWNAEVSVCVSGSMDWQETQAITHAYGAALRVAVAQHQSLGNVVSTTKWMGEKYLEGERTSTRTMGLIVINFQVTTASTMNINGGPPSPQYAGAGVNTNPTLLPPADAPNVRSADVTVNAQIEPLPPVEEQP